MPIVYTLKLFMIGFSLVSRPMPYTFNPVAEISILQETRFQATQIGSDSHKDEAKEAV